MKWADSKFRTDHYALSLQMDVLGKWAEKMAASLHNKIKTEQPIFCFAGLSGTGHAAALALAYQRKYGNAFGMMYVRKEKETSHGRAIEVTINNLSKKAIFVFVDDMVFTGATRKRVLKAVKDKIEGIRSRCGSNEKEFIQVLSSSIVKQSFEMTAGFFDAL